MKYEDTILTPEEMTISLNITKYKPPLIYQANYEKLCKKQAEVSFKAGIKELLEWQKLNARITSYYYWQDSFEFRNKLKELGIENL